MSDTSRHPEDFSPYLDKDLEDSRYQEIENHLNSCRQCAEELNVWQKTDSLFRAPELVLDVPPFQWSRIAARLQEPVQVPVRQRWLRLLFARPAIWGIAAAVVFVSAALLGGLEYRRKENREKMLAHILTTPGEQASNPFREYLALKTENNPFDEFRYPQKKENPFSQR